MLWRGYLKDTGRLLITVPAYKWLWSEHDIALHHYRRYTISNLRKKLTSTGYVPMKRTYAIIFFFPLIVAYRLIGKIIKKGEKNQTSYVILPNSINNFFIFLLKIEAIILSYISFPFGTSILSVSKLNSKNSQTKT